MSLGSCFAENMSEKFNYFKFQNTVNPFGIIFNPVSIENIISRIVHNQTFTEADIFFHNDLWHCYEVHSALSNPNKQALLQNLNQLLSTTHEQICTLTHCLITYGTSWVYRLRQAQFDANSVVANCHKVPQNQFEKEILSVEIIEKSIKNTIDLILKINPNCVFIFTISPVRHLKDGFNENQRSKAHLIIALHNVVTRSLCECNYFPSYEIMMDELRDYRFYADDLLHPSTVAVAYIWDCFSENFISETCFATMEEVNSIQKAMAHKAFNPDSESHQQFLLQLQLKKDQLQHQFPHFSF